VNVQFGCLSRKSTVKVQSKYVSSGVIEVQNIFGQFYIIKMLSSILQPIFLTFTAEFIFGLLHWS